MRSNVEMSRSFRQSIDLSIDTEDDHQRIYSNQLEKQRFHHDYRVRSISQGATDSTR